MMKTIPLRSPPFSFRCPISSGSALFLLAVVGAAVTGAGVTGDLDAQPTSLSWGSPGSPAPHPATAEGSGPGLGSWRDHPATAEGSGPGLGSWRDHPATGIHVDVRERILDNGVTVLVWPRPSAGRMGARVFYRVDVAAERPGTVGLTHMLEHFLFMGSDIVGTSDWAAERPFAEAVERIEREITDERNRNAACFLQREVFGEVEVHCSTPKLDSLEAALLDAFQGQHRFARGTDFDWIYQPAGGTGLTASTGRDWMKFDIDLPANRLELFMWMERSRLEHPVFRFFEPEREVVVDQIRRGENRPDGPFQRVLRSMTYDAHPYGWAHWFSDLTRATREDQWEIFHTYFIPQNTVIVIVGEVEPEEVFRQAEAYWGSWLPGRPSPRLRTVEPQPVGEKRLEVEAAAGPSVVVHVPMPAVGHPDVPAFQVLAELLGGDRGLLERALVEGDGVAISVSAAAWLAKYPSHFALRANARSNDHLEAAEVAILRVLDEVGEGSLDPALLRGAVDRLVLDMARGLERIGPSAVTIGAMESIYGWRYLNDQPGLWAQVTPGDLARVVHRYFSREMRTVGVLRRAAPRVEASAGLPSSAAGAGASAALPSPVPGGGTSAALPSPIPGGPVEEWARGEWEGEWGWARPLGVGRLRDRAPLPPAASHQGAIAEHPWYAPPWLAEHRPSRFAAPPPAAHWRDIPAAHDPPRLPELHEHRLAFPDGSRAIVMEDPLLPLVQLTALVDARTLDDPGGKEGLASLTATLLRRGGAGGLPPEELEERLRALGASISVEVNRDRTRVHLLTAPESAVEAARLLVRIVYSPAFDSVPFAEERERAAVAAGRALDEATVRLSGLFHRTLFEPGHPLARRPTPESVRAISREDVLAFHGSHFTPARVVFALSGRIGVEEVERALEEELRGGRIRHAPSGVGGEGPRLPPPPDSGGDFPPGGGSALEGIRIVAESLDIRQGHVMLGHPGLDGFPDDHAALEVMHYILAGGAFVSRMMELLRTQTGITSALYGSVEPGRGVQLPYLWRFSGNPETIAEGIRLAVAELERMRDEGVTEEEFEGARTSYIQGLIPSSYETPHRSVERLAQQELFGRYFYQSPGYLNYYAGDDTQVEALRRLTLEEVNGAARKYLRPEALVVAIVGPMDEIRAGAGQESLPWVTEGSMGQPPLR
jgi:predicted Zn-dependent peptidase